MDRIRPLAQPILAASSPPWPVRLVEARRQISEEFWTFWQETKTSSTKHVLQLLAMTMAIFQLVETGLTAMEGGDEDTDDEEWAVARSLFCIEHHTQALLNNALRIPRSNQRAMREDPGRLTKKLGKIKESLLQMWSDLQQAFPSSVLTALWKALPKNLVDRVAIVKCLPAPADTDSKTDESAAAAASKADSSTTNTRKKKKK
jgi:hypothetical protein